MVCALEPVVRPNSNCPFDRSRQVVSYPFVSHSAVEVRRIVCFCNNREFHIVFTKSDPVQEAGDVFVVDRVADGPELVNGGVGVHGVPQHDAIEDEAERPELGTFCFQSWSLTRNPLLYRRKYFVARGSEHVLQRQCPLSSKPVAPCRRGLSKSIVRRKNRRLSKTGFNVLSSIRTIRSTHSSFRALASIPEISKRQLYVQVGWRVRIGVLGTKA